jgi:hypothetical protein
MLEFPIRGCKSVGKPVYLMCRLNKRAVRRSDDLISVHLESAMRFVALLLVLGLFGCKPPPVPQQAAFVPPAPTPPTMSAAACVRPPEKDAFDVANLKSQLTVIAIACQEEEKYNSFVGKYRPTLLSNESALKNFFGRAYGKRAQTTQDDFITQLANAQSQQGIRSGTSFCPLFVGMFDEVMKLPSADALPAYAKSKPIQQAMGVTECGPQDAAPAKPAAKPKTK